MTDAKKTSQPPPRAAPASRPKSDAASSAMVHVGGWFATAFAWCWIAASPIVVGAVIGGIAYLAWPGTAGTLAAGTLLVLGIAAGVWCAERARRRGGVVTFMSHLTASPDLDDLPPLDREPPQN